MELHDYLKERGRTKDLAGRIGISPAYLYQMATRRRPVPPDVAPQIEHTTDGLVRRWDLRPEDWHRIWPELIGTEGAPAVSVEAGEVGHG
ncbi:MAG: helix-turn-helix domain-containing protein [Proteobacteria bacterium]|nr:helix-turn-helix domain-containing protein [Pseudomonadota bacterium]